MDPQRWNRVQTLFNAALEKDAEGREAFLQEACAGDQELLNEVHALLVEDQQVRSVLHGNAVDALADSAPAFRGGSMEHSMIGKVIDNYRITGVLGRGGMGVVYKATEVRLDRDVAIKMMDVRLASEEGFLKRFQSEARALARLQDPHIVGIFTLRETELGLLIVMEYVDGQTLADIIKASGPPPLSTTIPLFKQLLTAFEHAHRAGIIHRDIKPSNVMVTRDGTVKVTDFGLAKIQHHSGSTVTMGTGGTLYYMSPEQLKGLANVDQRGDLYSIGMTLYEALTGSVPFNDSDTDFGIREAIVRGKIPAPQQLKPDIPKELNRIVMRAIEKDPDRRFQTAGEMRVALEESERSLSDGKNITSGSMPQPGNRWKLRLSPWLLVPIVALLIILAVSIWNSSSESLLSIGVNPPGAAIEMNGIPIGIAPLEYSTSLQRVQLHIAKEGFRALDTSFATEGKKRLELELVLVRESPLTEKKSDTTSTSLTPESGKPGSPTLAAKSPAEPPSGSGTVDRAEVNPIRSPEDLATYLASSLRRKTTLSSAKVMVMPFTFEDTGISSRFSSAFRRMLEQKLTNGQGWTVVHQPENVDPGRSDVSTAFALASGAKYMLTGTYWAEPQDVRFVATLRKIPDAAAVGGAQATVRRDLFTNAAYSLRPQNFTQAVDDLKVFNSGVQPTSDLTLDVWTNRGRDDLLFVEGEKMQAFVRVNKPCFIRFIYHLANGKRALLDDNIPIRESDVGKPYRIPDEFECAPPFGAEVLQVFARTERFEPVETIEDDGYSILKEDLQDFLIAMRGMKLVSSKKTLQAESRVVLTTVER